MNNHDEEEIKNWNFSNLSEFSIHETFIKYILPKDFVTRLVQYSNLNLGKPKEKSFHCQFLLTNGTTLEKNTWCLYIQANM